MKFLIGKPVKHIELFREGEMYYGDVEKLYDMIPSVLDDMEIEYKNLHIKNNVRHIHKEPDSIYLAWHNHGTLPNIWHLNTAYIPDYFYFDKTGYGPWSEIVDECDYKIPVEIVRKDIEKFCKEYIDNNVSRFEQPNAAFIPDEPYVLVLGQRPEDPVSQFAYIDTMSLPEKVANAYKGTKYRVCTKIHPHEAYKCYGTPDTIEVTGNLNKCIAGASAVYTVNSGSGFESLLHGKRVFTTGRCDYHWATTKLKTDKDIRDSIEMIDEPIDEDNRIQFLHFMLNYHFMNVNDTDSIYRKIIRAVMEYE